MAQLDSTPRPLSQQDAHALVCVLAGLEGGLLAGDLAPGVVGSLTDDLSQAGLLNPGAGPADARLALVNLNRRLRYVLGEYDQPPAADIGEADHHFGFATRRPAEAFADAARARSESAAPPAPVDGRSYDDDVRWQVTVRTVELPLSAAFTRHAEELCALAAEHGGTWGGWQSHVKDHRSHSLPAPAT